MKPAFWIRQFAMTFAVAFIVIAGAQFLVRGRSAEYAAVQGLIWGAISTSLYIGTRINKSRKQQACAVCEAVGGEQPQR